MITVETSPLQCAGLNRHEAEEEEASLERTSRVQKAIARLRAQKTKEEKPHTEK
jgi:hypothetical protein